MNKERDVGRFKEQEAEIQNEKSQIELMEEELKKNQITQHEKDIIGELANISFGSASIALSTLLDKKIMITTPTVEIVDVSQVEKDKEQVILCVEFTNGLEMRNLFVLDKETAFYISGFMMGKNIEEIDTDQELTELELSAVQEAMNQMMGMAATSMSELFGKFVNISTPSIKFGSMMEEINGFSDSKKIVQIGFDVEIEDRQKSKLYQFVSVENAKKMVAEIVEDKLKGKTEEKKGGKEEGKEGGGQTNETDIMSLLQEVTVKLELVYGHTKVALKEFLTWEKNNVIELKEDVDEPLKMFANGILVAEGELVNVDGYYGLKITKTY